LQGDQTIYHFSSAQLVISADQLTLIKDIVQVVLIPLAGWMIKRWIARSRELIHFMITDNVNRSIQDVKAHIDERIEAAADTHNIHVSDDERRFNELNKKYDIVIQKLNEISDKLKKM
jgi:hypothetical protein